MPGLLTSFKNVDRTFTIFAQRARLHITNIRPSRTVGRAPTSVEKFASAIVSDWRDFVSDFSGVVGRNLSPLHAYLAGQMPDLLRLVRGLSHFYDRPHAILATAGMPKAKAFIATLKTEAAKLKRELAHSDPRMFDAIRFEQRLVALAEKVGVLFPDVFPNNAITLGTVVECKRDLLIAFEKAIGACQGMQRFGYLANNVTDAIFEMSRVLEETCGAIGVSKTVCFESDYDQTIELDEIEERQTVAAVMTTCDRIQRRLLRITGGRAVV